MMKNTIVLFFTIHLLPSAHAQTTIEKEMVMRPINALFEGMQKGDSAMVHSAFSSKVTMASIGKGKDGKPLIKYESSIRDFLNAIGTPHSESYNEMIWDEKILIDGNFAQVWTSYAFYLGKKFSHCGVDAFHLVKDDGGAWKIFHLADTRQREGCNVPSNISKQFQ